MISLTSSLNDLRDEVKFKYVIRYKDNELSQFNLCVEECLGVPKVMPDIELTLSQEWVEI